VEDVERDGVAVDHPPVIEGLHRHREGRVVDDALGHRDPGERAADVGDAAHVIRVAVGEEDAGHVLQSSVARTLVRSGRYPGRPAPVSRRSGRRSPTR